MKRLFCVWIALTIILCAAGCASTAQPSSDAPSSAAPETESESETADTATTTSTTITTTSAKTTKTTTICPTAPPIVTNNPTTAEIASATAANGPAVGGQTLPFTAQEIRIGYADLPKISGTILRTDKELETFLASVRDTGSVKEKLRDITFDTNALVAVTLTRSSGSDRPAITKVSVLGNSSVKAEVRVDVPPARTADMAGWLLLASVKKTDIPAGISVAAVTVNEASATPSREPTGTTLPDTLPDGTIRCTPDKSGLRFLCRKGDCSRTVCAQDCTVDVMIGGQWRPLGIAADDDPAVVDLVAARLRDDLKSDTLQIAWLKDGGTVVIRYDGYAATLFHKIIGYCPIHGDHHGDYYEGILFAAGTGIHSPDKMLDETKCPLEQ